MFLTCHGILVSDAKNTLHLSAGVQIRIKSLISTLLLGTEIHTARKLTYADEISTANNLILKRRFMYQTVKSLNRTDIGVESQFLTHAQKALLRTHL